MNETSKIFTVETETDLTKVSAYLVSILKRPSLICLNGSLGAGKTTFMNYSLKALNLPFKATSPTFARVHEYEGPDFTVFHLDLYRALPSYEELEEIMETKDCLVCIEWASRLKELMAVENIPFPVLSLDFQVLNDQRREIKVTQLSSAI